MRSYEGFVQAGLITVGSGPDQTSLLHWYKFNTGITEAGSGVSQWADQVGTAHLAQGTDANRPTKVGGAIRFNGIDEYLSVSISITGPSTLYILLNQKASANGNRIWSSGAANPELRQTTNSGEVTLVNGEAGVTQALDTYNVVVCLSNGASSLQQLDLGADVNQPFGTAGDMNVFSLGAHHSVANFSNIEVKEVLIYNAAHNAAKRDEIVAYLQTL